MSDILEEIQELSNKFSNLFEVDDLGQPAMDVPPSQNKIKRDRKTKDGKVELVSVEDELFPYEGNKREQYRQKILDTINNMIQGKATLEDLLQIVRQKKAPLKEAMELMENIYDAIRKKHGKPEYDDLHYTGSNKSYELMDAVQRAKDNEVKGAAEREGKSEKDILIKRKETKNSEGMRKTRHRSDIVADPWSNNKMDWYKYGSNDADRIKKSIARHEKKNSLKEAMELMENVHYAINKRYKNQRDAQGLPSRREQELHQKALSIRQADTDQIDAENERAGRTTWNADSRRHGEDTKNAIGMEKTQSRQRYPEGKESVEAIKASIARHEKKEQKKTPLKEAIELMETIRDQIEKTHSYYDPYDKEFYLTSHGRRLMQKVGQMKDRQLDSDIKREGREVALRDKSTKNAIGSQETRHRSGVALNDKLDPNIDNSANSSSKGKINWSNLGNHDEVQKSIARHEKKNSLKEAMELMETALTAIRNSGLPKEKQQELTSKLAKGRAKERELADEKAFKSWAKGDRKQLDVQTVRDPEFTKNASGERKTRLRSHSNNYTKSGGRKIKPEWKQVEDSIKRHEKKAKLAEALSLMEEIINEISDKTANSFLEKRVINALNAWYNDDKLNKKEDDAVKALIKRKARQGAELSDDEKKRIKEALSLTEEIINELNADTVNNALNKRIDQDIEADEKDRVNFNNILKIKDRDERAKAYKDFKKKYDERNAIIDKRMDRYEAYAKRHPEILEAVEKYVDNDGNTHELEFSANKNKYKFDHKINGKSVVSAVDSEPNASYERKHAVKNYGLKKVEEALSLMEDIISEATPLETKRRIANQFKDKMDDKLGAAHQEVNKALDRMNGLSKKIRKQGGDTVIVVGDKIENFHDDPEVKKNQVAFNKATDDMRDASKKEHKIHHLRNLVDYYKTNEALIEEADHHANSKNPVVKITDKNYGVASGKSLPGPFNKNHVGQYIVYNKDTDASYLVTPDNWKKSKIKRDLERQGKFYEALEETLKLLELFDRPDLLNDIDTALGSPIKKTFQKAISSITAPKKEKKVKECKK